MRPSPVEKKCFLFKKYIRSYVAKKSSILSRELEARANLQAPNDESSLDGVGLSGGGMGRSSLVLSWIICGITYVLAVNFKYSICYLVNRR